MKILLIEDEKKVSAFIKRGLENERFTVETAFSGKIGLDMALDDSYEIIILDLMLPVINGFTILKRIRESGIQTPVLILSAKGEIDDRIHGLNLGADDYLVKPFSFGELLARLKAIFRRRNPQYASTLVIRDLEVNTQTREIIRNGHIIDLTAKEYALLEFFVHNVNRAVSRVSIGEHVWRYDFDPGTSFIDVNINRLRKKLNDYGEARLIHTVRGYGYIMKDV